MMMTLATLFASLAAIGLLITLLQGLALIVHGRTKRAPPSTLPAISILKPLCGLDDGLADNLERFCNLDYPDYELILSVAAIDDAAYPLAQAVVRRYPARARLIIQDGEHGLNPKVSQLIGLARAARHDVLTVSDSNVRVSRGYLKDIAACLGGDVGVVTHLVLGKGERTLGAAMDNLHLTTTVGPGVLAARIFAGKDVVIGKSMTLTRDTLDAIGGFAEYKDVLAEDYFIGQAVIAFGKRVAVGRERVFSVARTKSVGRFFDRYTRWSIMHRHAVGRLIYAGELLLCPITFAHLAAPSYPDSMAALVAAKLLFDLIVARTLRDTPLTPTHLFGLVLKDLSLACMLVYGFFADTIVWRGNRRRVLAGTQLEPVVPVEVAQ